MQIFCKRFITIDCCLNSFKIKRVKRKYHCLFYIRDNIVSIPLSILADSISLRLFES